MRNMHGGGDAHSKSYLVRQTSQLHDLGGDGSVERVQLQGDQLAPGWQQATDANSRVAAQTTTQGAAGMTCGDTCPEACGGRLRLTRNSRQVQAQASGNVSRPLMPQVHGAARTRHSMRGTAPEVSRQQDLSLPWSSSAPFSSPTFIMNCKWNRIAMQVPGSKETPPSPKNPGKIPPRGELLGTHHFAVAKVIHRLQHGIGVARRSTLQTNFC